MKQRTDKETIAYMAWLIAHKSIANEQKLVWLQQGYELYDIKDCEYEEAKNVMS